MSCSIQQRSKMDAKVRSRHTLGVKKAISATVAKTYSAFRIASLLFGRAKYATPFFLDHLIQPKI